MISLIKAVLKKTFIYPIYLRRVAQAKRAGKIKAWESKGRPAPPIAEVKQDIVTAYARNYGCKFLVETGTFKGDMVAAQMGNFDRIYSIELSKELHEKAADRFRGNLKVVLLMGDSGQVLSTISSSLPENTLFYLDGHWSSGVTAKGQLETPIIAELNCLFSRGFTDVILIDDARCFDGTADYPPLEELKAFCLSKSSAIAFEVADDMIRITPIAPKVN